MRTLAHTEDEDAKKQEGMPTVDMKQMDGYKFTVAISALDCTGCNSCANECPVKALNMVHIADGTFEQPYFDYAVTLPVKKDVIAKFGDTVKGTQFRRPLLEFSGACAGCGESPYVKLATQLFGDRMYIANAT